ncbi:MAG: porin family protein [Melioribacteraceae bacterium]|nr:porin family protein [Melioribacteraceae bacterium]MCF8263113.1 porin family protein [Melioribacteraceae bacterium]MCF8413838.1 porin family protein [Melioribacteraceae bacterium]MCF8430555.1 porin family protein [Melioribacteraceae bacterium]
MKKLAFVLLFCAFANSYGQYTSASIKLGTFVPDATDAGFVLGYMGGKYIDENLDIGWSVDWFHKTYVDKSLVTELNNQIGIPNAEINELRARTNLHDIPVLFNMVGHFPLDHRKLRAYVTGGIGAEILLVFYRDFTNPDEDDLQVAFDFSWRLGAGVTYELGKRSDLLAEIGYHSSEPSWTYEVDDNNVTRTFERRFDMSGFMFRVGVRLFY